MTNHPNRSKKKLHDADIANRAMIAKATEFSVYQYRHRARYIQERFATLAAAAEHATAVERANPSRPCLIYGYVDGVAHTVPADMRAAASAQSNREDRP